MNRGGKVGYQENILSVCLQAQSRMACEKEISGGTRFDDGIFSVYGVHIVDKAEEVD